MEPVRINGFWGHGGAVMRPALVMAALTGRPVQIDNPSTSLSRAGNAQYYKEDAESLAGLCGARIEGSILGKKLVFTPRQAVAGGPREIIVGGHVPACLVAQSVVMMLAGAGEESKVTVRGVTHMEGGPSPEYLETVVFPAWKAAEVHAGIKVITPGYEKDVGGEMSLMVKPCGLVQPVKMEARGRLVTLRAYVAESGLRKDVGKRGFFALQQLLLKEYLRPHVERRHVRSSAVGIAITLVAEYEGGRAGFTSYGKKGVPVETVAQSVASEFLAWRQTGAATESHLAEQLAIPMALAAGTSKVYFAGPAEDLRTRLRVLSEFVEMSWEIEDLPGNSHLVTVNSAGFSLTQG